MLAILSIMASTLRGFFELGSLFQKIGGTTMLPAFDMKKGTLIADLYGVQEFCYFAQNFAYF